MALQAHPLALAWLLVIRVWLLVLMLRLAPKATPLVKLLVLQLPVPLRAVLLPVVVAMAAWAVALRAQGREALVAAWAVVDTAVAKELPAPAQDRAVQ